MKPRLPAVPRELGEIAHLLFDWPRKQAPRLSLPLCILVAALVQGALMVLFSVNYNHPSVAGNDPPQVYFIPPDSPVERQLAPWLAANDPAVFSPQSAAREVLPPPPPLDYRPSYEEPPPPLKPLPEPPSAALEPLAPPLGTALNALNALKGMNPPPEPPTPDTHTTVVHWQDGLAARAPAEDPPPASPAPAALNPSLYEVEAGPEGRIRHCILLETSGDAPSDDRGREWILGRRFRPAEDSSWGRVLIVWGTQSPAR